jgi:YVTN family beta-propeller protein
LTRDGSLLLTANPDSNSVTVVQTDSLSVLAELPVGGDPRTVAVTEDSERAVVANRAAGSMSLIDLEPPRVVAEVPVGRLPWGVLLAPDGASAYVACEESDHVAVVDLDERAVRKVIPVYDRPNGLALSADGKSLYVTHLLDGRVSVIDLSGGEVSAVIETWPDSNLSQSIVLHLDGRRGYLPQTRSNNANPSLTFDSTVFPLITAIDLIEGKLLTRGAISLPEADMPVGLPYDAAFSPEGDLLYVVNAASNDLSVIDLKAHVALAHIEVQDNPRGIVLSHDGQYAYVNNTLAGTLSVIDTATQRVIRDVQVTQIPLPPVLLHGKRLFHSSDSQALSRDQWISCNTCHWEGEHDGRTWLFRFAGPRNTTSLLGMVQTYPLRWSAEWDEAADSEFAIIQEQYGVGLLGEEMHPPLGEPNSSRSYDLDALGAFLDSLQRPPNPYVDAYAPQLVREGAALFDAPDVGCRECHPPPYYTDFQTHNVGTAEGERELLGPEIDTPTLLSLYRSAPYLHDGSAATLMEVLTSANPGDRHGVTSGLEESDLEALVAYMLTLH